MTLLQDHLMFVLLQAIGKPHTLWCAFAKFYDRHGDLASARMIFEKATEVQVLQLRPTLALLRVLTYERPRRVGRVGCQMLSPIDIARQDPLSSFNTPLQATAMLPCL